MSTSYQLSQIDRSSLSGWSIRKHYTTNGHPITLELKYSKPNLKQPSGIVVYHNEGDDLHLYETKEESQEMRDHLESHDAPKEELDKHWSVKDAAIITGYELTRSIEELKLRFAAIQLLVNL